jgi:Domain of unknown function (DUF4412)
VSSNLTRAVALFSPTQEKPMRRFVLSMLVPALAAAPLAAQTFEGVVTVNMPIAGGALGPAKYHVKGTKIAIITTTDASMGPMFGGKEVRNVIDNTSHTMTMLIPMEMAGMKGVKMVIDMNKAAANAKPVEVKSLGTTETIAGYKCENFSSTEGKNVTTMCISSQLGTFAMPGSMGGRGNASASWVTALASHPGFPLRVTGPDGKLMFEAVSVEKTSVPDSMFVIPEGYNDMSGMVGRMGGRGGGR